MLSHVARIKCKKGGRIHIPAFTFSYLILDDFTTPSLSNFEFASEDISKPLNK